MRFSTYRFLSRLAFSKYALELVNYGSESVLSINRELLPNQTPSRGCYSDVNRYADNSCLFGNHRNHCMTFDWSKTDNSPVYSQKANYSCVTHR